MKLKYNQNGVTETIPLSTRKRQGKRLAIHHNDQNHYAPVVPTDDPKASNLPVGVNGEIFAVQAQEPPEVTAVNVAPSSVAVMQGQSATATVSAIGNDAITGLSYGLSGAPTWITISDDLILIQPSDNDLGIANVQVYAQDTGSDAMSAAILRAEAKLRPIIESLSVIPPAVTVQQGQSAIAGISAVANEAVTGLSYSLNGASSWINLNSDYIYVTPTDNDLGTNVLDVIAYDTNSSASAATQFVATAALRPIIESMSVNPPTVAAIQGESTTATISAVANEAVTGLSYSLDGNPDWMNLSGSVILMTPTENDSGSAAVTVTAQDTGSTAYAQIVFNAEVQAEPPLITDISIAPYNIYQNPYWTQGPIKLSAIANNTAKNITYSLQNAPSWMSLTGDNIYALPPENTVSSSNFPVTITAADETNTAQFTKPVTITANKAFPTDVKLSTNSAKIATGSSGSVDVMTQASVVGSTLNRHWEMFGDIPNYSSLSLPPKRAERVFTVTIKYPKKEMIKSAVNKTLTFKARPINAAYLPGVADFTWVSLESSHTYSYSTFN